MRDFTKGMLARSKAGHDTGKWYVVMDVDQEYVYLADGEARTPVSYTHLTLPTKA